MRTAALNAIAPSQFTEAGLKLVSPVCVSGASLKPHSPAIVPVKIRMETSAINPNAMMLMLTRHL